MQDDCMPQSEIAAEALLGSPVRPTSLSLLSKVTGIGSLVRDEELRVRWCDDTYAALCQRPMNEVIGTTLHDFIPTPAASERESVMREVLETGRAASTVQFGSDKRLLCRILPIDEASFGFRGVLCLVTEGPLSMASDRETSGARLIRIPCLDELATLTRAELRTLFDIACGHSNQETATRQHRSVRTIENHVEAIHKKLGTKTRSSLVRFATERGVHRFTTTEWDEIVESAFEARRDGSRRRVAGGTPIAAHSAAPDTTVN